jgi:sterol desaturase/sphingolipid hydroxylase (fatty acid hydroxylase superfamily)
MKLPASVPAWLSGGLVIIEMGFLFWLERRRPLRRSVESKLTRNSRNLAVAGLAALTVELAEKPVVKPLARLVERRGWGLLKRRALPRWAEAALALALMDYTLYIWHVLMHRASWLWRFHLPHHVDLDMDASTALRFHFSELALSVPWRAGQIVLIGVSPFSLSIWQTFLMLSILLHHSNVELPSAVERWLGRLLVTPRMHGIHHSVVQAETNSNWSSGLTLWDWLHGTLRRDVPQKEITIGVPAYRAPEDVILPKILAMPFKSQRPTWRASETEVNARGSGVSYQEQHAENRSPASAPRRVRLQQQKRRWRQSEI